MVSYFKRTFALSDEGAKNLYKASISCCVVNIFIMIASGILYNFLSDTLDPVLNNQNPDINMYFYVAFGTISMVIMYGLNKWQYDLKFLSSYKESAKKRISLSERLRKLPLSYFSKKDLSDLTTVIMTDTTMIESVFSHYIPDLFGAVISTSIISIGVLCINFKMGMALMWVVPISFILVIASKKIQDSLNNKNKQLQLMYSDGIQECIENIKEIKSNNQVDKHMKIMKEKLDKYESFSISTELIIAIFVTSAQMILKIGITSAVLMGVHLLILNEINLLQFLLFMMIGTRIFDPLSGALINLAAAFNSLTRINRMKEIENHSIQEGDLTHTHDGWDIEFEDVNFSYSKGESVINGISFTAKQGQITALIGPSGGGKSTVAKLASRFWDIDSGKIKLGGVDVSKIDPEELMKNYSIVFQDVLLFNNTVIENIRIGKKDATDEEVYQAAKLARCEEFVSKMKEGYNTLIGENGCMLSGGERQRISIARALLKDAPIILLDEATASLDIENESLIQEAISTLIKDKTVIVIAHRMRTIAQADKIIVLEEGRIIEEGTHNKLINEGGIYYKMIELQMKSSAWTI